MRSSVTVVSGEDEIAGAHELQNKRHGRHASARNYASFPSLQLGECVRQILPRRIAGARVIVKAFLAEPVEREGRREVDWRYHCTVVKVGRNSSAHGARRWLALPARREAWQFICHESLSGAAPSSASMNAPMRCQSPMNAS